MCDTFVALASVTEGGSVLLAKNADTEVNEAQHLVKIPRRRWPEGAQVRVTHRVIAQAAETYEAVIDKSFWLYGGEIGANEHGVAIGNEAVFSNGPPEGDGVVLIDLLRLMLERARNRHEAVAVAADLLKTYGQGGNCELRGNSHFDGSFIISDRTGAVVLETAGRDWATREVERFTSISNAYTIGSDWAETSLASAGHERVDFGAAVGDPAPSIACGAFERRAASYAFLERQAGRITVRTMADLLRHTGEDDGYHPAEGERPTRVCMHAGPFESRFWQATGSLISDVRADSSLVWATGTSGPDCSIFKPIFFGVPMPDLGPMPRESDTPGAYWWRHERLHRRVMADYATIVAELRPQIEALEDRFFAEAETVRRGSASDKASFVSHCWGEADALEARWLARLESRPYRVGHPAYEAMWARFNAAAALELA
jgi:secernin